LTGRGLDEAEAWEWTFEIKWCNNKSRILPKTNALRFGLTKTVLFITTNAIFNRVLGLL